MADKLCKKCNHARHAKKCSCGCVSKGGKREGAGAPKKENTAKQIQKQLSVRRDVALDVLDEINKGETKLNPSGKTEKVRWIAFLDSEDESIAFRALDKLKDCADGKAAEKREETIVFDPNQPLRVVIEHIGGSKNPAAAQAK